jgi:tetratricopeptide (TPR) repeat protein
MPSRIHTGWAAVAFAVALLAGCSSSSTNGKASSGRGDDPAKAVAETADYSASAVRARTESHAHYAAAILHEQNDEPELAAEEFYKAAMADPSNESMVMEATGRLIRFRPGDKPDEKSAAMRDKAAELLKRATARPEASGALFARLGLVYSMLGKKDLAVEANRKAIQKAPDSLAGYQYLAQLHLQNNQPEAGLKVLDEAARQPNPSVAFLIELGETYAAFGRTSPAAAVNPRALDAFKRAAALKPGNPAHLQRLADGFNALGEIDLAVAHYLKLAERLPNLTAIRDRLVELYLRKQDRTNAAVQLRAVIRESPANPQTYYLLGSLLFEEKNSKEAAECFEKTLLLSPSFEPVYYDLALAQINLDQSKEALKTLERARGKFQQNFVGEFYTALAYTKMKDYTNSLKHLTSAEVIARATATNRLTHGFYFQLGSAYERNQKFKEAETYFRKALELQPDFPEALNYLGYMWAERGENLKEAREMIEKAVKIEPTNSAYLDSLGWVLFRLDLPGEALPLILKAIEHNDEPDATLYDHLGDIYAALKKTDKAREAWQKSLAIEPSEKIERKLQTAGPGSPAPSSGSGPR